MKDAGYEVNDNRKHISMLAPGQKHPTRLDTLKGDHTEAAIRERLAGNITPPANAGTARNAAPNSTGVGNTRVSLLIDIQAKIQ